MRRVPVYEKVDPNFNFQQRGGLYGHVTVTWHLYTIFLPSKSEKDTSAFLYLTLCLSIISFLSQERLTLRSVCTSAPISALDLLIIHLTRDIKWKAFSTYVAYHVSSCYTGEKVENTMQIRSDKESESFTFSSGYKLTSHLFYCKILNETTS